MKDFMGNELKVGDRVVYTRVICGSPLYYFGRVNSFTPHKVKVGNFNVFPDKCIKIVGNGVQNSRDDVA